MMQRLSGRKHFVHTGVCLIGNGKEDCFVESSEVCFAALSEQEIEDYIATDEPYDKAGGYGIQGKAAKFCTGISGCYFNIMGLPVSALYRHLRIFDR